MKTKLILCLALVLSGGFILSYANETNTVAVTNSSVIKIVSPQCSVDLPKLGQVVFAEQPSNLSLQVPIGFKRYGEKVPASNSNTVNFQVWLLKADGTSIPQSEKPTVISMGVFGNFLTDYMFYEFPKVPVDELSGVVVSVGVKLYCHEMEKSNGGTSLARDNGDIFQISPTNISDSPISVQVTNADSSVWFTVFYKTDETSDKFLNARLELSEGDSITSSESVKKIWTTNGFKFEFNIGYVWPFTE